MDQDAARLRLMVALARKDDSNDVSNGKNVNEKVKGGKPDAKKPSGKAPAVSAVSEEEFTRRFDLIHSVGEECVSEDDLKNLLRKKNEFRLYDGFEPSGRMHIAQGIFRALNVNKCTSAGGTFVFWVADWFALMNDKMGGDLDKIKVVGEYFLEVWKGAGMGLKNIEFRWASDDVIKNAQQYWDQMLDIAKRFTITRIKKCCQIMGRLENNLTAAQVLYPLMQCSDIFFLRADICQLGIDQRKVNMLAREYCDYIGRKLKPVILSHHMLFGLAEGQAKMSKSNPDSAIFMEDEASEVERKMNNAYCPKDVDVNPCLDYVKHIVMTQPNPVLAAGGKEYKTFEEVKKAFVDGSLAEADLKKGLSDNINVLMQPVRDHFATDPNAKRVLSLVREYKREEAKPPSRLIRMSKLGEAGQTIAVMSPCPTSQFWSLSAVTSTKRALKQAKKLAIEKFGDATGRVIFYIPDLNAVAMNCFGHDKKKKATDCIAAAFEILLAALGCFNALEGVRVVRQSETMLMDPSDYWISVINVGRRFQLDQVHEAVGLKETGVGHIVGALMHVGDIQALASYALITPEEGGYASLHNLAVMYIRQCADQENAIEPPQVVLCKMAPSTMSKKDAEADVVSDLFVNDKWKPTVAKKLKQAFCEPGNIDDSPVLELAESLLFEEGLSLEIKRVDGSIGIYDNLESVKADVGRPVEGREGEFMIHPGDIKQAASAAFAPVFARLDKAIAAVPAKSRDLITKYKISKPSSN